MRVETSAGRKRYIQALKDADNGKYEKLEILIHDGLIEAMQTMNV